MKKINFLVSFIAITALALPLFVSAAPGGAPPTGLVAPTFNGLIINNGSADNLTILANGAISNAAANVVINDSLEVSTDLIISGDSSVNGFAWNGGDTRLGDNLWVYQSGVIQNLSGSYVDVRDSQGFSVGSDGGTQYFFVNGSNGRISNPNGAVYVDDSLAVTGVFTNPTGDIDINDNVDIQGNIRNALSGDVRIDDDLTVTRSSTFVGAMDVNGGINVSGGHNFRVYAGTYFICPGDRIVSTPSGNRCLYITTY